METHYEKNVKEQTITQYQPEASAPLSYANEFSLKDKENLFKEIYSNLRLFENMLREIRQNAKSNSKR